MTQSAPAQVARLLALLPYLLAHPGARVDETARLFEISEAQLVKDLNVLWFSGLPGLSMGDYIEIDMEAVEGEGVIRVGNADYLSRPLRLNPDEAVALLVALRTLAALPGVTDGDAVARTIRKLERASGAVAETAQAVAVEVESWSFRPGSLEQATAAVGRALRDGRRLHLSYWVPGRDETTERDVDPMRLFLDEGRLYLEGWCRLADDVRIFRLDRVAAASVLDVAAEVPAQARPRDLSAGLFQPSPDDLLVTFELEPAGRWVAEYYPCESVAERGGGGVTVTVRTPDPAWARRLALRLGPSGRLVAPPELAEQVRERARAALVAYGG